MFFLNRRKRRFEVQKFISRLIDQTTPNYGHNEECARKESRINRAIPVLVVPLIDKEPDIDQTNFAVTRDISSQGASVISQHPVEVDVVVLGFWQEGRCELVRAEVRHRQPIDGGFWQIGMELTQIIPRADSLKLLELSRLADRLTVTADENTQAVSCSVS